MSTYTDPKGCTVTDVIIAALRRLVDDTRKG